MYIFMVLQKVMEKEVEKLRLLAQKSPLSILFVAERFAEDDGRCNSIVGISSTK